jgi:hypothetical protein
MVGNPRQMDGKLPAAVKPNEAIVPVTDEQSQTVIPPGTASNVRDAVHSSGARCELDVEDGHWRRYFGPQYHRFRNVQFE